MMNIFVTLNNLGGGKLINKSDNKYYPETSQSLTIALLRARESMMLSVRPILMKYGFYRTTMEGIKSFRRERLF